jgi:phosphonoacetaldehyde hydrolase
MSLIQAVVFDISGTIIDFGSRGPVRAFVELFARHGITITESDARRPMGTHKLDHLKVLFDHLGLPHDNLHDWYREFPAIQAAVLPQHLDVIPGLRTVVDYLDTNAIPYGATTGFELAMLDAIIPAAAAQGYRPAAWLTPDQVGGGRPHPWMIFELARRLGRYPLSAFVKVGDTPVDIAEAHNAGAWAVAVVNTGNEMGLSATEWAALPADEQQRLNYAITQRMLTLGAHYAIGSIADLPPVLEDIEARLSKGDKP